jgi:hypothetical protein
MKWSGVIGIVVLAAAAACSADRGTPTSTTPPRPAAYGCSQVSVDRWVAAEAQNADEPNISMPQPPDWKHVVGMNSDLVRLILRDDNLGGESPPSVVITVTDATGRAQTPKDVIDAERKNVTVSGATSIADVPGTVCGFPSRTLTYTTAQGAPAPRPVTTVVVAPQYNNKLFDVVVTTQAADSANPAYVRDTQIMLTGLQIKAPVAP